VAGASTEDPPSFKVSMGGDAHGGASPPGAPAARDDDSAPVPEQSVDGMARLVGGPPPAYPDDARAAGVEGDVHLELVVDVAGAVRSARVLHGVERGLDESAMRAVRQFQFTPATKGGRPVNVRMAWSIRFRLQ
jgi:protein TonB